MDAPTSKFSGNTIVTLIITSLSVATVAVALRFYARLVVMKDFGSDDWAVAIALLTTLGTGIIIAICTKYGLGQHVWTLPPESVVEYEKVFWIDILFYNAALMAIKSGFLLQYRRVFPSQFMQVACKIGLAVVISWGMTNIFITIFGCIPIAGHWDHTLHPKCLPRLPMWYTNGAVCIITDFAIFFLPLPALSTLHLDRFQKCALMGVFSVGFFTCAISIIRIQSLKSAASSTDPTWGNAAAACWSTSELSCGLTCVCIPKIRPLFTRTFPQLFWFSKKGSNGYHRDPESNPVDIELGRANAQGSRYGVYQKGDHKLEQFHSSGLEEMMLSDTGADRNTATREMGLNSPAPVVLATKIHV